MKLKNRLKKNAFPPNVHLLGLLVILLIIIDALGLLIAGISLAQDSLLPTALPVVFAGALGWIYTKLRPDSRIAALAFIASITFAFMAATGICSYLTVMLDSPLIDRQLVAADHAIGLNWLALYNWVAARPLLHKVMKYVYLSLIPQMLVLQIVLNYRTQMPRAWELLWLFALACIGCLIFAALWPAMGAFGVFHVQQREPYVQEFAALRAGTIKVIGETGVQGVIQFPSLHAALAILFTYAARGIPFLFPLLFILNGLVILATPSIGGHHIADLWGGIALAIIIIMLARTKAAQKLFARG